MEFDWASFERELFAAADAAEVDRDCERAAEFRRAADRISSLILFGDLPRVDIEMEIETFRRAVLEVFPDKGDLFDSLYRSRFMRLWEDFRDAEDPLFGGGGP